MAVLRSNTGLTERATLIVKVQVGDDPVQSAVVPGSPSASTSHPTKVEPAAAEAVRVTDAPPAKPASQVPPQLIPAGLELTVPEPKPIFNTFIWGSFGSFGDCA